jgi:hypothetical protein
MSDSLQNIELVERYFDNEMTEDEAQAFLERLKTDLELRHMFDRERLLIKTVQYDAVKNNLLFLKDLDRSLPAVSLQEKKISWLYYAAAATVTLLTVFGVYFYNASTGSPEELYAENFQPYTNVFEPTERGVSERSERARAFEQYDLANYQEAAILFSRLTENSREPQLLLLLGNSNLAIGNTEEAIANFMAVIENSKELRSPALWYLSLAWLKAGNEQNAKETLNQLLADENPYSTRARELVNKLK